MKSRIFEARISGWLALLGNLTKPGKGYGLRQEWRALAEVSSSAGLGFLGRDDGFGGGYRIREATG